MKGDVLGDDALVLDEGDNVATLLSDLEAGHELETGSTGLRLREAIPFGHKVALEPIEAGDAVYKYGAVIGQATRAIEAGEWVHTHNCESMRGRGDLGAEAASGGEQT